MNGLPREDDLALKEDQVPAGLASVTSRPAFTNRQYLRRPGTLTADRHIADSNQAALRGGARGGSAPAFQRVRLSCRGPLGARTLSIRGLTG